MEQCYSMVFSWMMQNLEVFLQPTISPAEMTIVIPGTQIPKWFNKQNASTSINLNPSAVIDNPNWIGVVICVLFVTHEDPMNLDENHDPILYGVNNVHLWPKSYSVVDLYFEKDLVTVELDHLLTVFYSREEFIHRLSRDPNTMHDLHGVQFETSVRSLQGLRVVVKNCGYRWVFKEDLQQLNSNMFFRGNSSSRKRKLLISN
ncbi:hypothetical protein VNO80_25454 [Phaseolus coccineus]|uniref:C-JID domain-containing protein n=1 Tax=Phaseolus coccineus TaxID=3886 RepID=A0AAN9QNS1_PHACN